MAWSSALESHPEHVKAIGMISIENVNMDLALSWLLGAMLGLSGEVSQAIYMTAKQNQTRLDIFRNIMRAHLQPAYVKDVPDEIAETLAICEDFYRRATALSNKRHSIMHDLWGSNEHDAVIRAKLPIKDFVNSAILTPLDELKALIKSTRDLITEIQKLSHKLNTERLQWLNQHHKELLALEDLPQRESSSTPL